mmetsp:Transcript_17648/g.24827  ORF Transcript_17648/g.24827 Transcript_17648/m.24827 type:complete len:89 (+) Transcript_17648:136-402(+)
MVLKTPPVTSDNVMKATSPTAESTGTTIVSGNSKCPRARSQYKSNRKQDKNPPAEMAKRGPNLSATMPGAQLTNPEMKLAEEIVSSCD